MSDEPSVRSGFSYRGLVFASAQIAVLAVVVGAAVANRDRDEKSRRTLPPMRSIPPVIGPLYNEAAVASDRQVRAVLYKLRPRLAGADPKINHVDHALRLWGIEAEFRDPECLSGTEMRDLLLSHAHFAEAWGPDTDPLLVPNEHCVEVRTKQGHATASHVDHTLAGLAEVGTPLDYPLETPSGPATVQSLLEASLRTFDFNQVEYEWSTLAYTLYLKDLAGWRDVHGQEISFDLLAERIMRERAKLGVCFGNHRLHALVILLRVDEKHRLLSSQSRADVIDYLQQTTSVLVAAQDPDGFWNQFWATGIAPLLEDDAEPSKIDPQARRLLATGHVLEWWALAPAEVLPPRDVLERAGQWICQEVIGMEDEEIRGNYTFLTHVGRALALWRGRFPADFIESMEEEHEPPI